MTNKQFIDSWMDGEIDNNTMPAGKRTHGHLSINDSNEMVDYGTIIARRISAGKFAVNSKFYSQATSRTTHHIRNMAQHVIAYDFAIRPDFDPTVECGVYVCDSCGYPAYRMEVETGSGGIDLRCWLCSEGTFEKIS